VKLKKVGRWKTKKAQKVSTLKENEGFHWRESNEAKRHTTNKSVEGLELQHGKFPPATVTGRTGAGAIIGDNDKKGTDSSII
jgi:hypothetical protein